jgi:hypothetical protein
MSKFKLLIIDDDSSREGDYRKIFADVAFDLIFVFEKNVFFEINTHEYDCFAIDISLDNWTSEDDVKYMFNRVVEKIGKEKPLILVSSKIKEVIHWTNELLKHSYQTIYTIALAEITVEEQGFKKIKSSETSQIICNNIINLLCQKLEVSSFSKGQNENINILHISDIQFGDSTFSQHLCDAFPDSLYRFADEQNIIIDFIVVTGDVAFDGSPSQFEQAHRWFRTLAKRLLGNENYTDRILFAPGNHDINLSLSTLNNFKYKYPSKGSKSKKIEFEKRAAFIDDYTLYALDPFRDFAFKTTKNNQWLVHPSLSFFDNRFSFLGFRFLHLNCNLPYKQLGQSEAQFGVESIQIENLQLKIDSFKKSIPTIVLSHPSPVGLGYNDDGYSSSEWRALSNLLVNCNAKLFLFGHTHNNIDANKMPLSEGKSIIRSGSSTLFVEPGNVGGNRSFKILNIIRENNLVKNYKETQYLLLTDGRILPDTKIFESNEKW